MSGIFHRKPQDIAYPGLLSRLAESLSYRRFAARRDGSVTTWLLSCGCLVLVMLVLPDSALATISTDASAAGWQGVQGKVHKLFTEGIAPIATYAGIGIGVVTMAATDRPAIKAVGGSLAGLGLMVSAGPTIMQTLSGTAIF